MWGSFAVLGQKRCVELPLPCMLISPRWRFVMGPSVSRDSGVAPVLTKQLFIPHPSLLALPWSICRSFWFAGDTGMAPVFKEIGERLGPFDLAAIPIGACEFLCNSAVQNSPLLALQRHGVARSSSLYVTWPMQCTRLVLYSVLFLPPPADEPHWFMKPQRFLRRPAVETQLALNGFIVPFPSRRRAALVHEAPAH